MNRHYAAIVVGAGITGASTAYHLKREGLNRVLLVERGTVASGGTGKSAAIVRQHYSTALMARLALASVGMFERMEEELGVTGAFAQTGYLMLVPPELKEAAEHNLDIQRAVGVDTRWLAERDWSGHVSALNPEGVAGIVHEPRGGRADPIRCTEGFVNAFVRLGGELRLKTPCRALIREGNRISGILLDDGPVLAGTVINAAGPWARPLAESAGLDMPLRSVREQDSIWQARSGRPAPRLPISNAVDAIYTVPQGEGRVLVGQGFPKAYVDVDPYNYKETADDDFVALMQERAERRFPPLSGMQLVNAYAALYDVTPDWYPLIGPRAGLEGYADACGGSGHGFKIGPAIGAELARWLAKGEVADDFAQLSYDRIPAGHLFVGAYGGNRG